jgi:hypothetical protein
LPARFSCFFFFYLHFSLCPVVFFSFSLLSFSRLVLSIRSSQAFEDFEALVMPSIGAMPPSQDISGDLSSDNLPAALLQRASFFVSPEATNAVRQSFAGFLNNDDASSDAAIKAKATAGYGLGSEKDTGTSDGAALVGSTTTTSMAAFLASANLDQYAPKLAALGYSDVEDLSDRHILDDNTLVVQVGMTKDDVRALRAKIAREGTNPTMMKAKRDKGKGSTKPGAASSSGDGDNNTMLGARKESKYDDQAAKDSAAKGSVSAFDRQRDHDQAQKDAAAKGSLSSFGVGDGGSAGTVGATREQDDQALKSAAAKGSLSNVGDGADSFMGVGDIAVDVSTQGMQALRRASGTFTQSFAFVPGFGGDENDGEKNDKEDGAKDLDALAEEGNEPSEEGAAGIKKRGTMI